MIKFYIGLDNGVSGTVGVIDQDGQVFDFFKTPSTFGQDYTKAKKNISRIEGVTLMKKLSLYAPCRDEIQTIAIVERPLVNPQRFVQSISAVRAFEATLVILETLKIPYRFIDSKEWQKELLPKGTQGSDELKKASLDIGRRLFPERELKHPDMDGILIAEYARRKNF